MFAMGFDHRRYLLGGLCRGIFAGVFCAKLHLFKYDLPGHERVSLSGLASGAVCHCQRRRRNALWKRESGGGVNRNEWTPQRPAKCVFNGGGNAGR